MRFGIVVEKVTAGYDGHPANAQINLSKQEDTA